MTKMFGNLTGENLEQAQDRVGGGREALPSGVYDAVVKMAYAGAARSGAQFVQLILDINGQEVRETVYVTNKKGENFFVDKNDSSKKHPLPGFTLIDDICLFATEEALADQETANKIVKIYDFDARTDVPTEVPVLTGLLEKPIKVALLRRIENKEKKGDDGNYHPTNETRTINVIEKALHPETGRTVNEYRHGVETAEYQGAFLKRWLDDEGRGKDDDRSTKVAGGAGTTGTGRPGAAAGGAAASPKKKLFG